MNKKYKCCIECRSVIPQDTDIHLNSYESESTDDTLKLFCSIECKNALLKELGKVTCIKCKQRVDLVDIVRVVMSNKEAWCKNCV
jgi:hypothetical protein